MNDLATFVAGEIFSRLDIDVEKNVWKEAFKNCRHMSFVCEEYMTYNKFKAFERANSLRTFLAMPNVVRDAEWQQKFYLSSKILVDILPQLPLLRVLSLSGLEIDEVPECVSNMKHLRYLNLSRTRITQLPESVSNLYNLQTLIVSGYDRLTKLPESVCNLYNLQTLIVSGCDRLKLPDNFLKLKHLRHFDIRDTLLWNMMPLGISKMKSLQTLSDTVEVVENNDSFISWLRNLKNLQAEIYIDGLQKLQSEWDIQEVNLSQKRVSKLHMGWSNVFDDSRNEKLEKEVLDALKPHSDYLKDLKLQSEWDIQEVNLSQKRVSKLHMGWSNVFDDSRNEKLEKEVLDALKPHSDYLKDLVIESYGGKLFPNWIGDPSFLRLTNVCIRKCGNCMFLPPLGELPSLLTLVIEGLNEVKVVDSEFLGTGTAFPKLESLRIKKMRGWEVWSTKSGVVGAVMFPCLQELFIEDCPNLGEVSLEPLHSLRVLHLSGCGDGVLRSLIRAASSVTTLNIYGITGLSDELAEIVAALPRKLIVYVTHHHRDHVDGLSTVQKTNPDACLLVHENTMNRISKDDWSGGCTTVSGTEDICIGGERLRIIFAPGHTDGHLALLHVSTNSLIVGDHCVGQGSAFLDINSGGNMSAIEAGSNTLFDIVAYTYAEVDRAYWIPAASNVRLHVDHLAHQNKLPTDFSLENFSDSCSQFTAQLQEFSQRKFQSTCTVHFFSRWIWAYLKSRLRQKNINFRATMLIGAVTASGIAMLYSARKENTESSPVHTDKNKSVLPVVNEDCVNDSNTSVEVNKESNCENNDVNKNASVDSSGVDSNEVNKNGDGNVNNANKAENREEPKKTYASVTKHSDMYDDNKLEFIPTVLDNLGNENGVGRTEYARVLVEFEAEKGFKNQVDVQYRDELAKENVTNKKVGGNGDTQNMYRKPPQPTKTGNGKENNIAPKNTWQFRQQKQQWSKKTNNDKREDNNYAVLVDEDDDSIQGINMLNDKMKVDKFLNLKIQPSPDDIKKWTPEMHEYFKRSWEADREKERQEKGKGMEIHVEDVFEDESLVVRNITANEVNRSSSSILN
ncbi:NB-ARC domains-containing protein [Artemisia annua]|uniref:NB-ARC domains-containing protein n=1 Tax=Artemisia annua TaxID=35608 RepID=A0A2U1LTS8_ARTAN|nr:NB-ARC domains-containing protein [Artemisia annua]